MLYVSYLIWGHLSAADTSCGGGGFLESHVVIEHYSYGGNLLWMTVYCSGIKLCLDYGFYCFAVYLQYHNLCNGGAA